MYRLALVMLVCGCVSMFGQRNSDIGGRGIGADTVGAGSPQRQNVSVRGTAELESGEPAPTDTLIELTCMGAGTMEEEVRTDGTFAFQFSIANQSALRGPSYGTNFGVAIDCRIQAMLNGHYSPQGAVFGQETTGMFDAGKLVLYKKDGDVTGMTVSATSLEAPKSAQKEFQKGQQAAAKKKWKDAIKQYEKAIAAYPEYAEAWNELGRVQQIQKRAKDARASYEKALELDADYMPPAVRLALLDVQEGNWEQVASRTGEVLKANPYEFPEAYLYNVLANYQLDKLPEAEAMARKAIARNVQRTFPQMLHTLGMVLAAQGRLEEAISAYDRGARLKRHCEDKLREAKERIEKISLGPDGSPRAEPLEEG